MKFSRRNWKGALGSSKVAVTPRWSFGPRRTPPPQAPRVCISKDGPGRGRWELEKLRESAVKSLESFVRVNLCGRQSRSKLGAKLLLVQVRSGPLPAWLAQVAQWIGFAFLKLSIPRGGWEASRLNGMIAHRAHSHCLTISAAPGKGLRYARKRKRQSDRSNDHSIGRSSARDRLRHLGFLFNSRQSQLVGGRACGRILALFGRRPRLSRRSSGRLFGRVAAR